MPTPITINGLEDFVTTPTGIPVGDGEHFVMAVVHQTTPGSAEIAHTVVYLVSYKTWASVEIGRSEPLGKDMGGFPLLVPGTTRQTVILIVGEATPGGAGSTGVGHAYVFPDAVPAALPVANAVVDAVARATANAAAAVAKQALDAIEKARGKLHET